MLWAVNVNGREGNAVAAAILLLSIRPVWMGARHETKRYPENRRSIRRWSIGITLLCFAAASVHVVASNLELANAYAIMPGLATLAVGMGYMMYKLEN